MRRSRAPREVRPPSAPPPSSLTPPAAASSHSARSCVRARRPRGARPEAARARPRQCRLRQHVPRHPRPLARCRPHRRAQSRPHRARRSNSPCRASGDRCRSMTRSWVVKHTAIRGDVRKAVGALAPCLSACRRLAAVAGAVQLPRWCAAAACAPLSMLDRSLLQHTPRLLVR